MNKITLGVIMVLALGGAFYGGIKYDQNKSLAQGSASANQGRQAGFGGGNNGGGTFRGMRGNGGVMVGDIIAKDATSITVQKRDGGSGTVFFTSATPVLKTAPDSADDLKVGETILVTGVANQDGSVSAQSIQIRPAMSSAGTAK